MNAAIARYRSVQVTTSSREQVLLMLWDGLFRFLDEADVAHQAEDRAQFATKLRRAHAILDEFTVTLDTRHAPELCERLQTLYFFAMARLTDSVFTFDLRPAHEARRALSPVYSAFREVLAR